jgi:hypothetical protein
MDEVQDAKIQPDGVFDADITGVGFVRSVPFDVETGVPRACLVFFHGDVFHVGIIRDGSVNSEGNLQSFA